jgi:hypothetical protein
LHEVRRFERTSAARIKRHDDVIGGHDRLVDDERPSWGAQNRLPNGRNSNDGQTRPTRPPIGTGPASPAGSSCWVHLQTSRGHRHGRRFSQSPSPLLQHLR